MNSALDDAARLIRRAKADLTALCNMGDRERFDDNIFGFHAQQAVEKALKAWLAFLELDYPYRHDLGELISELNDAGENVEELWMLVELTPFAVQLRYDDFDVTSTPDRELLVQTISALVSRVEQQIEDGISNATQL